MKRLFKIIEHYFVYIFVCRLNKIKFLQSKGMKIGKACEIVNALGCFGTEPYLIELKDNVTISANVFFLTHDAASRLFRSGIPGSSKFGNRFGRILVNENCFIGAGAIILPDIEIGPNCIIGAGSVVTRNVPPNTIYAGNPARMVRNLDEYIEKYKNTMIKIDASNRTELRKELTLKFWNEFR